MSRWQMRSPADLESWAIEQPIAALTITMTGELADCFADRAEGVRHIVSHACEAAARLKIEEVVFYGVDGRFSFFPRCLSRR